MVSGILHKSHPSQPTHNNTLKQRLEKIPLGNSYATYQPPDQAYKYLGVHISLTLNWKTQLHSTIETIHNKGLSILTKAKNRATPTQCLRIISQCVRAAIKYPMIVAPFSLTDIHVIDRAVLKTVKLCCSLPRSFPTRALHLPKTEAGLGVPSLLTEYTQITATALTQSMNDQGHLGILTRALLDKSTSTMTTLDPLSLSSKQLKYMSLARQLEIIKKSDIIISWNDTELLDKLNIHSLPLPPQAIPVSLMTPFHDLDIYSYHDLVTPMGTHLISTTDLSLITLHKITKHHKRSLNRLTAHLSSLQTVGPPIHSDPLPLSHRQLAPGYAIAQNTTDNVKSPAPNEPSTPLTQRYQPHATVTDSDYEADPTGDLEGNQWWAWPTQIAGSHAHQAWGCPSSDATWSARHYLCKSWIRHSSTSKFYRAYKITPTSHPDRIREAMTFPDSSAPPACLLHLTYGSQYKALHITSWRGKRSYNDDKLATTTVVHVQWAPTIMHNDHINSYTHMGYSIHHSTPLTSTTSTIYWKPQSHHAAHLAELVGQPAYAQLTHTFKTTPPTTTHLNPRKDIHLTNLQQQGQWATSPGFNADNHNLVHKLLKIDTHDRHPDWDIQPP